VLELNTPIVANRQNKQVYKYLYMYKYNS